MLKIDDLDPEHRAKKAAVVENHPGIRRLREQISDYGVKERARCDAAKQQANAAWVEGREYMKEASRLAKMGRAKYREAKLLSKKSRFRKELVRTMKKRIGVMQRLIEKREDVRWWKQRMQS